MLRFLTANLVAQQINSVKRFYFLEFSLNPYLIGNCSYAFKKNSVINFYFLVEERLIHLICFFLSFLQKLNIHLGQFFSYTLDCGFLNINMSYMTTL